MIPRRWAYTYPGEWKETKCCLRGECTLEEDLVARWEEAVAQFVDAPYAAAVNSGRYGMTLILDYLGVGEGDEVVVPAYTLGDLIPLVEKRGAKAIPADVDRNTLNVTVESVQARITSRTKAILVLHAFGAPAPIREICAIANDIPVIEDGAHALGATVGDRPVGTFGYAGFFSFEPTKPINTYGGGMVVSRDAALIQHIHDAVTDKPLNMEGLGQKIAATRKEQFLLHTGLGWPILLALASPTCKRLISNAYRSAQGVPSAQFRYSPLQAQLGLRKLEGLSQRLATRTARVDQLRALLHPDIRLQGLLPDATSTWYFCVALLPRPAQEIRTKLLWKGVDTAIGDEIADDCAVRLQYHDCPNTAYAAAHAMALPMSDTLPESALAKIAHALNALI